MFGSGYGIYKEIMPLRKNTILSGPAKEHIELVEEVVGEEAFGGHESQVDIGTTLLFATVILV